MKNKKILTVICIIVILVIIALIYIAINKTNHDDNDVNTINNVNTENTLSKEPNIPEDKSLSDLSFNGIKIGDKLEEKMKNKVFDWVYLYEYENIGIDAYANDNIYYLGFFSSIGKCNIEDVNIAYNGYKLETVSDFKENFGDGIETEKETNELGEYYSIYYYDNDLELYLYIKNDRILNVVLSEKDIIM